MKEKLRSGKLGRIWVLGLLGLTGVLASRAQDDASEKKNETVTLEQPAESQAPSPKAQEEDEGGATRRGSDVVMVGNDYVLKADEVARDVVIVSGNATIDGRVSGDLVVVGGSAKVSGRVDGEMTVILGSATLEPSSEIERDVTVVGGALTREPGSKIGGVTAGNPPQIRVAADLHRSRSDVGQAHCPSSSLGLDGGRHLSDRLPADCRVVSTPDRGLRRDIGKKTGRFLLHGCPALCPDRSADVPAGGFIRGHCGYSVSVLRDDRGIPFWEGGGLSFCRHAIGKAIESPNLAAPARGLPGRRSDFLLALYGPVSGFPGLVRHHPLRDGRGFAGGIWRTAPGGERQQRGCLG